LVILENVLSFNVRQMLKCTINAVQVKNMHMENT